MNETGASNLKFHADSPSLQQLGKLVDLPITGIAKVDGTVTGNRSQLQAAGNVTGDGVKYGENGALTLSSDYTVKVPDLRFADAQVSANTRGTFVSVAGQDINELNAKTDYANRQLTFDATAKQPQRSLNAAGAARPASRSAGGAPAEAVTPVAGTDVAARAWRAAVGRVREQRRRA